MSKTQKISLIAINSKFIHSNLAVRYIMAYLKKHNIDANILEFSINDSFDNIIKHIYLSKSDILGFSCYIWNREIIMKLGPSLKKIMPDSKIVLGGPEISYDIEPTMGENPWIDFIIFGEGEETFFEFANAYLSDDKNYENIDGLAFRQNNKIYVNKPRKPISNLDTIPFPYDEFSYPENKIIYYETSRGCPFRCQYCLSSIEPGVRYFSLDRVFHDIDRLISNNVKQVKLVDRTFNCNRGRAIKIMEYILNKNGNTNFHFEISAKFIDSKFLELIKKAPKGLFQFEIGVQSTNDVTLNAITRNESFNDIKDNIAELVKIGNCHIHLDLIAGLPFEDIKSFANSFNNVFFLRPHMLQLGFLKLLRGSKLRLDAEKYGIIFNQHPPYEVLSTEHLSYDDILLLKEIEELVEIYNNSGRFTQSINYLIENHYNDPFRFFRELCAFYADMNVLNRSIKVIEHYELLYKFVEKNIGVSTTFNELLKYDFFISLGDNMPQCIKRFDNSKIKNWVTQFLKNDVNITKYTPELRNMDIRQKLKYVRFEIFEIDIFNIKTVSSKKHVVLYVKNPFNDKDGRILSFDINEFETLANM